MGHVRTVLKKINNYLIKVLTKNEKVRDFAINTTNHV